MKYCQYLLHALKGFPVSPFGQEQIGFPLSSSQIAPVPQGFGSHGLDGGKQDNNGFPV